MPYLLGIDFGTTNVKAVVYDTWGKALASAAVRTETEHQGPQRAVYPPDKVWSSIVSVIRQVVAELGEAAGIEALAVASLGEAGVPLDGNGNWLYPAIVWFDSRTIEQHRWWEKEFGAEKVFAICGLLPGPIYSINKMMWLKEHEPHVHRRMAHWLCMADYITYKLTGIYSTSYSLASRTMAFDLRERHWSPTLLEAAGIDPAIMPPPYPSGEVVGRVAEDAAAATGLLSGTPVAAGGHDHICGALATQVFEEGPVLDSTGTAEALLTTVNEFRPERASHELGLSYGCHVARDRYYLVGGILSSGGLVEWLRELFWPQRAGDESLYQVMVQEAAASHPEGLFILPYITGGGAPHRDPDAWGTLFGLRSSHTRGDLLRAAFESLSYELRALVEALEEFAGLEVTTLRAIGGGTKNELWLRLKADITGKLVEVPALQESTALGAALLAGLGVGIYSDEREAVSRVYRTERTIPPDPAAFKRYSRYYEEIYRELYPLVRELYAKAARLTAVEG